MKRWSLFFLWILSPEWDAWSHIVTSERTKPTSRWENREMEKAAGSLRTSLSHETSQHGSPPRTSYYAK